MRAAIAASLAVALGACASTSEEPAGATPQAQVEAEAQKSGIDPVGVFEFSTVVDSSPLTGTFEITRRTDGAYTGRILSTMFPEIPITRVTVEGNRMLLAASMDGQQIVMELNFTGDSFTGGWSLGDGSMGGALSGKRKTG